MVAATAAVPFIACGFLLAGLVAFKPHFSRPPKKTKKKKARHKVFSTDQIYSVSSMFPWKAPPPPISVRGDTGYIYVGNMYRFDNKTLRLYGRRRHPDLWDYFAIYQTDGGMPVRVDVDTRMYREIEDGHRVPVRLFPGPPFRVVMHRFDPYEYVPYLTRPPVHHPRRM